MWGIGSPEFSAGIIDCTANNAHKAAVVIILRYIDPRIARQIFRRARDDHIIARRSSNIYVHFE